MNAEDSQQGRYKMRTFSQLTGLSPTVLRAWERRHGLLQPARPEGGHRLYTEQDLQVIKRVTELLGEGRAIGEIAAVGRQVLLEKAPVQELPPKSDSLVRLRDQILEAAQQLDSSLLSATLDRAFALFPLDVVLSQVIQPAAYELGARWQAETLSVAGEHMVSSMLSGRVERLRQTMTSPNRNTPLVVCACLPGEQHELGLLVLSIRLSSAGYQVAYLGRDLPLSELRDAVERLRAGAVCLSVTRPETVEACAEELGRMAQDWSGRVRVHLGGLGISGSSRSLEKAGVRLWAHDLEMEALFRDLFDYS